MWYDMIYIYVYMCVYVCVIMVVVVTNCYRCPMKPALGCDMARHSLATKTWTLGNLRSLEPQIAKEDDISHLHVWLLSHFHLPCCTVSQTNSNIVKHPCLPCFTALIPKGQHLHGSTSFQVFFQVAIVQQLMALTCVNQLFEFSGTPRSPGWHANWCQRSAKFRRTPCRFCSWAFGQNYPTMIFAHGDPTITRWHNYPTW